VKGKIRVSRPSGRNSRATGQPAENPFPRTKNLTVAGARTIAELADGSPKTTDYRHGLFVGLRGAP
jgi:hypothetical protein